MSDKAVEAALRIHAWGMITTIEDVTELYHTPGQGAAHARFKDKIDRHADIIRETMKPGVGKGIDQTKFGKPDGNCFAACLATIFNLPIEDIPEFHIISGESGWWFHFLEWSRTVVGQDVLMVRDIDHAPPGVYSIASGMAERGLHHAVVWRDGKLFHDPHPGRSGLVEKPTSFIYFIPTSFPAPECALGHMAPKICQKCVEINMDDLKAELEDDRQVVHEAMNDIWGIVYPGKDDWDYFGMVFRHVNALVDELRARIEELELEMDQSASDIARDALPGGDDDDKD